MTQNRSAISFLENERFYSKDLGLYKKSVLMTRDHDAKSVASLLAQQNLTKEDVLAKNKKTKQNALHYVLSGKLFDSSQATYKHVVLPEAFLKGKKFKLELFKNPESYSEHVIETEVYIEKQNKALKAVVDALAKPFLEKKLNPQEQKQLFLERDGSDSTILHYAYQLRYASGSTLTHIIRDCDYLTRYCIASVTDAQGKNIFHIMTPRYFDKPFKQQVDIFGEDVVGQVIFRRDDEQNTVFHVLFDEGYEEIKASHVVKKLETLISIADEAMLEKYLFSENNHNKNIFHLIASQKINYKKDIFNILKKAAIKDEKTFDDWQQAFNKALIKKDNKGNTPLHYLCESGDAADLNHLLNLLPVEKEPLIFMPNKQNKTLFHLACRYGDREMFTHLVTSVNPAKLSLLEKDLKKEFQLFSQNHAPKMNLDELLSILNQYTILYKIANYLSNRGVLSSSMDYEKRKNDFVLCLHNLAHQKNLPPIPKDLNAKIHFTFLGKEFKGSENYLQMRKQLGQLVDSSLITSSQVKEFIASLTKQRSFIEDEYGMINSNLHEILNGFNKLNESASKKLGNEEKPVNSSETDGLSDEEELDLPGAIRLRPLIRLGNEEKPVNSSETDELSDEELDLPGDIRLRPLRS